MARFLFFVEQGSQGAAALIAPKAAKLARNAIVRFDPVIDLLVVIDSEIVCAEFMGFSGSQ